MKASYSNLENPCQLDIKVDSYLRKYIVRG